MLRLSGRQFRLGQWIPRLPGGGWPSGWQQPEDPVSAELFHRIEALVDQYGKAWADCENLSKEWETILDGLVGLAPSLYEDPRNLEDPAMAKVYYEAFGACERLEAIATELYLARLQFRNRAARRMRELTFPRWVTVPRTAVPTIPVEENVLRVIPDYEPMARASTRTATPARAVPSGPSSPTRPAFTVPLPFGGGVPIPFSLQG